MRVTIDRKECTSCAACWEEYPDIFEEDDDGIAQIVAKFRASEDPGEGDVPDDLVDDAKSAAEECPAEVIHVDE